jgi:hypothetical protein
MVGLLLHVHAWDKYYTKKKKSKLYTRCLLFEEHILNLSEFKENI